jgi:hypothetical protein
MIATADSRISKVICPTIRRITRAVDRDGPVFPRSVINKCPAIIFAVNRTAKVPGRITFLIVSIHTINGIKTPGVPWGTK